MKFQPSVQWTDRLAGLTDHRTLNDNKGTIINDPSIRESPSSHSTATNLGPGEQAYPSVDISLRVEGPYFTPADPARYNTVVCFVAGTGVSGAIAIAGAFLEMKRQQAADPRKCFEMGLGGGKCTPRLPGDKAIWERCVVYWSVRSEDYVDIPFLKGEIWLYSARILEMETNAQVV